MDSPYGIPHHSPLYGIGMLIKFLIKVTIVAVVITFIFRIVVIVVDIETDYPFRVVFNNTWWGTMIILALGRGISFLAGR